MLTDVDFLSEEEISCFLNFYCSFFISLMNEMDPFEPLACCLSRLSSRPYYGGRSVVHLRTSDCTRNVDSTLMQLFLFTTCNNAE